MKLKSGIKTDCKKLLFLLVGILFAFGLAVSLVSPEFPTKKISSSELVKYGHGWEHIGDNNKTVYFLRDNVCFKYYLEDDDGEQKWNYREFYISGMDSYDVVEAEVCYFDAAGNEIARSHETWDNGYNLVQNPVSSFHAIFVRFYRQENASFTIEGMRLTETLPYLPKKKILAAALAVFVLYLLAGSYLLKKYQIAKIPQELLACLEDAWAFLDGKKIRKYSTGAGILVWTLILLLGAYVEYRTQVGTRKWIRYAQLGMFLLLLIQGRNYRSMPKKRHEKKCSKETVSRKILYAWLFLCMGMMISDFFVEKHAHFMGLILLLAGGYVLYHLKDREIFCQAVKEFIIAFGITAAAVLLYRSSLTAAGMWKLSMPDSLGEMYQIWKEYLSHMNLTGHRNILFIHGRNLMPFNGILRIGYRYGTVTIVPYLLVWAYMLRESAVCFRQKNKILWFFCAAAIFFCSMIMNAL